MTIEINSLQTALYTELRYESLRKFESYLPDAQNVAGVPHIGIGFNLTDPDVFAAVLAEFGIVKTDPSIATELQAKENDWYDSLWDAVKKKDTYSDNASLQSTLNGIMSSRTLDFPGGRATFEFTAESEAINVFNSIILNYEDTVDIWLATINKTMGESSERAALVSMAYQGWIGFSNGKPKTKALPLLEAIKNDDRAEAWYQIRYGINAETRRYVEAEMFGLYNDTSAFNDLDAKSAFRVYTRHGDMMKAREETYAANLDRAGRWGAGLNIEVQGLVDTLQPARDWLTFQYDQGVNITGDILVGENDGSNGGLDSRYYSGTDNDYLNGSTNNDLIFGESGDDVIYAGNGDDVIYGGTGNDLLKGGTGNDYYVHNTGDGFDTIIDSDGTGNILFNGIKLNGGYKINPTTFRSNDQRFVYRLDTDGSLSITDSRNPTSGITVENFGDGNLNLDFENYSGGVTNVAPFFYHEDGNIEYPNSGTRHNLPELIGTDADDNDGPGAHPLLASPVTTFIDGLGGDDIIDGKSLSGITIYEKNKSVPVFDAGLKRTRLKVAALILLLSSTGTALAGNYILEKGEGVPVCEGYRNNIKAISGYGIKYCNRQIHPSAVGFSKPGFKRFYFPTEDMMNKVDRFLWERDANPGYYIRTKSKNEWKGTKKQLDGAWKRYLADRNRRMNIGHYIGSVDIDNDGETDNVYLDMACNAYGSLLMVFNKDNTDIDYAKTDLVMRHPSRKEAGWPVFVSVKEGEASPIFVKRGYKSAPDSLHYVFYDVFEYKGQTYFDQIWSHPLNMNGKIKIEAEKLRVYTIENQKPKEVCTISYDYQATKNKTSK